MSTIRDNLFGRTPLPTLRQGLDAAYLRQRSVASNIANAQSSGYTRKVVDFEEQLRTAISRKPGELFQTHQNHLPTGQIRPDIHARMRDANVRIDGAGAEEVVIEREMADLAQTVIKFETEAKVTKQYFDLLNTAIRGMA